MSDYGDLCRDLRTAKAAARAKHGVRCPECVAKLPKASPSILLPQQTCRIHGYRDPRPRKAPPRSTCAEGTHMTTTQPAALPEPLGWYFVNNIGMATLCKDKAEAQLLAEECDMVYKRQAPHRAVQLVALQSQPAAAAVSDGEIVKLAFEMCSACYSGMDHQFAGMSVVKFARAILALRPQAVPMSEDKFVACLVKANCIGVVKMSYDSGPYYVTRPSINASKLKEAIEAHHGITQRADGGEVE